LRYGEKFLFTFPDGRTVSVDPKMEVNGAIVGNVIFGGGIGALIDIGSGRLVVNGSRVHAVQSPE
jgi:hypothetical protein